MLSPNKMWYPDDKKNTFVWYTAVLSAYAKSSPERPATSLYTWKSVADFMAPEEKRSCGTKVNWNIRYGLNWKRKLYYKGGMELTLIFITIKFKKKITISNLRKNLSRWVLCYHSEVLDSPWMRTSLLQQKIK